MASGKLNMWCRMVTTARVWLAIFPVFGIGMEAAGQCDPTWLPGEGPRGTNGSVHAMISIPGTLAEPEQLVVGGNFSVAGDVVANNIAGWGGANWHRFQDGLSGPVYALVNYAGTIVAGGAFSHDGGSYKIAVWDWMHLRWNPFSGVAADASCPEVSAMIVYDGDLIVAGSGGAGCVVRWRGDHWEPMAGGWQTPLSISALAVYNGELIAAGCIADLWNCKSNVVRWDAADRQWKVLGAGIGNQVGCAINALTVWNGELVAGGFWLSLPGGGNIARWDGVAWNSFSSRPDGVVALLGEYQGNLIAGGRFGNASYIVRWDGTYWWPLFEEGIGGLVRINTFKVFREWEGELYVGGTFMSASGGVNGIARWNGQRWRYLNEGMDSPPWAFTTYGGALIVGGAFTSTPDGTIVRRIAGWEGKTWYSLGDGIDGDTPLVLAMTAYDGDLIAGGMFSMAGEVPADNIARWDGSAWHPVGGGCTGFSGAGVYALLSYGGELIAAGAFDATGGVSASNIARWDKSAWRPLGDGVYGNVMALAAYGADLIVAGTFESAGEASANSIARWDGTQWWPLGTGTNNTVWARAVYNGELIAGGQFSEAGGRPATGIARWDGSTWRPLETGMDGWVTRLHVHDGMLIAGGNFTTAGGKVSAFIARWGAACVPADFDRDGDVDLVDFRSFQTCFNGPNRAYASGGCENADFDGDADVDLTDFGVFQTCFNGTNRPPKCG